MPSQEYDPRTGKNVPDQVETQSEGTIGSTIQPDEALQSGVWDGFALYALGGRSRDGRGIAQVEDDRARQLLELVYLTLLETNQHLSRIANGVGA